VPRIPITLCICILFAISVPAQQNHNPSGPPPSVNQNPPRVDPRENSGPDQAQQQLARDMAKKANLQRQAAIKADADRLLKLAVELKDFVDKSNENLLSVDVLKKAEEIERLAHSVKDKMKGPN
jgi:hypothetical protein